MLAVLPLNISRASAEPSCPHHPLAIVSLQHSQSHQPGQQLQHHSHSERPCLERFRACADTVGGGKKKTKQNQAWREEGSELQGSEQSMLCAPSPLPEVLFCNHSCLTGGGWSSSVASRHHCKETSVRREGRLEAPAKKGCFGFS